MGWETEGGSGSSGVTVRKNTGSPTPTRPQLNFIEGSNVTITVSDDSGDDEVDVTIASSGGGGGGGGGDIYLIEPGLKPPESPNANDVEFYDQPDGEDAVTDLGMAWLNQDTATAVTKAGRLLMTAVAEAGYNLRVVTQAVPSPFTSVSTRCVMGGARVNHGGAGLALYNSGNGRLMVISIHSFGTGVDLQVHRATSATSHSSTVLTMTPQSVWNTYLRWEVQSTDIVAHISGDAIVWYEVYREALSTHLSAITHSGLFVNQEHTSAILSKGSFSFLRYNWTVDYDPTADESSSSS